ncbi:MAG: hypothetical protein NTV49_04475, partial [Kiritimatiellaeota bacterium]|nr:hypothetical protein [Kiritimatiellota bacterium]
MQLMRGCVLGLAACGFAYAAAPVVLTTRQGDAGPVPLSLRNEARATIQRGLRWLEAQQQADGHWSNPDFPALTALPLWALARGDSANRAALERAKQYLLASVHDNGAIYREPAQKQKGGGLANYNTALCMVALHALNDPQLAPVILKARAYVAGTQHFGADEYRGGMGYDPANERAYADLSNSYMAYEAMRLTQKVEDQRRSGAKKVDLDWPAAAEFVTRIQNKPSGTNATPDPEAGGFGYRPGYSMAGTATNTAGEVRLRSYGSMTYAGLLSFIYADVDKNDPRVQSAFNWAMKNWSLNENPGMGQQGLFYFFNVLAKALAATGQAQLPTTSGGSLNWRVELIKKLVGLQKTDPKTGQGYWLNPEGRWWESDPVLVTSYSLL